jgi:6-phosphogluconolactonase (cycloisomerase 2 family)
MIYVNNDAPTTNSVSALAINPATGVLTAVPGSPFATGGGGSFAPNVGGISVLAVEHFLYATNDITNTVAAFTINDDGTLTSVPGSPFPTLGTRPNGLAVDNDETLLFVANFSSNNVSVFDIESNGALTLVSGSPLSVAGQPLSALLDSPDSLLFLSHVGPGSVGVYTVGSGGSSLTAISGSPFAAGGGERGLDVNAAHTLLYVADGSNDTVSGFAIGGGGTLTAVPSSPFAAGTQPTDVLLHPSLSVLYVSNDMSNDIYVYSIAVDGSLTPVQTALSGGDGTAGMVIDAANNRLFAVNGGGSATPSRDISVFDINPATGALTAASGSPFPTGASSGRGSAIALATLSRSTCTDPAPGLCSPGGGTLKTDCVAEWLVSTSPPPPTNPKTNSPVNRVICQNGNPGCDYDGDGSDDHCTFHVQVCVNNHDPRLPSCTPIDVASFQLLKPRPGASSNDAFDVANITAFETALAGNTCNNEPQTRSCLTDADCLAGGTCTNAPVIGVPFVHGKTPIIPPPPTPTPAPNSAANICSNIMDIKVPLRLTSSGFASKSKVFSARVRTSNKRVSDSDKLTLTCLPAS